MHILFLSRWFPYPLNNGSKIRILQLLRGLATRHTVSLIAFADEEGAQPDAPELAALCDEVHVVAWQPFDPGSRAARLGLFRLTPRSIVDTYSPAMAACIADCLGRGSYDLIIASQATMASYRDLFGAIPCLFEEVELGVLYEQYARAASLRGRARYGLSWVKHRRYLARLLAQYTACSVASERERALVAAAAPAVARDARRVEVVPNCVDTAVYRNGNATPQPDSLIFTGSFRYFANHEAMVWFLDEIYPLVQAQRPAVGLTITGDHAGLALPPATNVTLAGFVDDVHALIAGAWCSIVPLLSGGGTRLKILEAMALGTPVVATSKGAEGLDARAGEHLLVADTPQAFAAAVVRLLDDAELRARLARNGRRLVAERYDWNATLPRFLDFVEGVAAG